MKDFKDKVAVVTGGASGIGRGLAERCAEEGMKVVLADVEENALKETYKELRAEGADILAVKTDVSRYADIEALAQKTLDRFGAVHLLFNNAGVQVGAQVRTPVWENTLADWEWLIGVNLMGVVQGIKVFLPVMLKQRTECHVINTSSMAGLITESALVIYGVTKAGVIKLSEGLYLQLKRMNAPIGVTVLCPAFVTSHLSDAERNRPAELKNPPGTQRQPESPDLVKEAEKRGGGAVTPEEYADTVFRAIREDTFYLLGSPLVERLARQRMENILNGRKPEMPQF
jgi:NAD(P)-dependent dehydrogenase (short-subunit alcohol dehydrogenase family)